MSVDYSYHTVHELFGLMSSTYCCEHAWCYDLQHKCASIDLSKQLQCYGSEDPKHIWWVNRWLFTFGFISLPLDADPDPDAVFQYDSNRSQGILGVGDGHVAQHPIHPELLLVADKQLQHLTILNTNTGE